MNTINKEEINNILKYSSSLTVLYIEDSEETRLTTVDLLSIFFNNIIIGIDGKDGLDKYIKNKEKIDLIITDINMPNMNGLDMIKEIKKINNDISIIISSAYTDNNNFIESIKLGIDYYLLKPMNTKLLLEKIKKISIKIKTFKENKKNLFLLKEYKDTINDNLIVSKLNIDGNIIFVNDNFCKLFGYKKEEIIGKYFNETFYEDISKDEIDNIWNILKKEKKTYKKIIKKRSKNNFLYYIDTIIKPILNEKDNIIQFIIYEKDITKIMNPHKILSNTFEKSKNNFIVYMKIEDYEILENFYDNKSIEIFQIKIKKILNQYLPKNYGFNKIFSLNNGEYAIITNLEMSKNKTDNCIQEIKEYQKKISDSFITYNNIRYNISIIMSISNDKNALQNVKLGIKKLLKIKQNFILSNNLIEQYKSNAEKNIIMLNNIQNAIKNDKIISYFQPIINNKTQKIEKYESLVRLVTEENKILSPFFFLDIAKKGKYYTLITNIVLEKSFEVLNRIKEDISINLSILDIEKISTREKIFKLLEKNKKNCNRVIFELLEDEHCSNFELIKEFINKVKKLGVKIAIDDFGSGYSNFERLLEYQPDILKIDGSLIKKIETDKFTLNIIETIVSFCKKQNIQLVAEYVENEQIFNIIKKLNIDYSQGYFFGKPQLISISNEK